MTPDDDQGGLERPGLLPGGRSTRWPLLAMVVIVGFAAGIGAALTDDRVVEQMIRLLGQRTPAAIRAATPSERPPAPPTAEPPVLPALRPANQLPPVAVQAARDGHFYLTATVNGTDIRFLIDTGATVVVLSAQDAARLGLRPASWEYTHLVETAHGRIRLAQATLNSVRVGALQVDDVTALVGDAGIGISLLGMSFLQRLDRYEVRDRTMYLYR